LLFRRDAYEAIGGHEAVRSSAVEDLALVRRVKRSGLRWRLLDGSDLVRCRMYENYEQLYEGLTKNLLAAFDYRIGWFYSRMAVDWGVSRFEPSARSVRIFDGAGLGRHPAGPMVSRFSRWGLWGNNVQTIWISCALGTLLSHQCSTDLMARVGIVGENSSWASSMESSRSPQGALAVVVRWKSSCGRS
jgi:hypothetical protein